MCDKNITINENSNFSCWENHETTRDEKEIIDYFKNNLYEIKNKKILHVGIGNSELGLTFYKNTEYIDGLTISVPEKIKALNYKCYRNIHICNKYNLNDMKKILNNKYDIIIDQGIKQYTCCQIHFEKLFKFYIEKLHNKGFFITSKLGMNWSGYDLKTAITNEITNNRICFKTNDNQNKKLSLKEIKTFAQNYNLHILKPFKNVIILNNY